MHDTLRSTPATPRFGLETGVARIEPLLVNAADRIPIRGCHGVDGEIHAFLRPWDELRGSLSDVLRTGRNRSMTGKGLARIVELRGGVCQRRPQTELGMAISH